MALKKKKLFLGDMLIAEGVITPEQRDDALTDQRRVGKRLGEVLISRGLVTDDVIARVLSKQLGLPYMDMEAPRIDSSVLQMVPQKIARKHKVLPIERSEGGILLAMADPLDVFAMDEIKRHVRMHYLSQVEVGAGGARAVPVPQLDLAVAPESGLLAAINKFYSRDIDEGPPSEEVAGAEDTPVVRLLTGIINQAAEDRASDIHIEPQAEAIRVRFRIDGILHEVMAPSIDLHPGLVSRVKILSGMDIAEKRAPQDGRFDATAGNRQLDVRASSLPTLYGEKVMLRLLEKATGLPEISELGFTGADRRKAYETLIERPYGFILATGPTGCGKTTTMYSSLQYISTIEKNVITVEDPIEYDLGGINQVQVNRRAGLTFTNALRSILRQDPDVIMIGEIRDFDTASIAMHAALTGHLVLSTLHTNDSIGAVARLMDMGVEPYIITSSLVGVLGQRLIRRICPGCREETEVSEDIFGEIGVSGPVPCFQGRGCQKCRGTGYFGREGLFEILVVSESVRRMIVQKASESELREQAVRDGFRTLRQEGLVKVTEGTTTLEEVLRVTAGVE
ncbi:MAG: ATPase, T2SS/T4P/T4SS family [Nitrospirota bacterium]|jgi:type IV pilus assembly protein PilB